MRFSNIVPAALALAPAAVSATAGKLGFALGDVKTDGSCKETSDYVADLKAISSAATLKVARIYSVADCNSGPAFLEACKETGFKAMLGVWADYETSFNNDLAILKEIVPGNQTHIHSITVGSEVMYRGYITADVLLERVNIVKEAFPAVTVGVVDSWNKWYDGTGDVLIQGGLDFILANGFSYWQGYDISNSTKTFFSDMELAMQHIQDIKGSTDFTFMVGETGWPTTGGTDYENAIASTENAAYNFKHAVCGLLKWGIDIFYFEAFDEPQKAASTGDDGTSQDETHWGAFSSDRVAKFTLTC